MKRHLAFAIFLCSGLFASAQTVDSIAVFAHNGQVFIRWSNIPVCDTGFYYVYRNTVAIEDSNTLKNSEYLGRVLFNFGFDFRFTTAINDGHNYYLVYDDTMPLSPTQNIFVANATQDGAQYYYAVRCDFGKTSPNWTIAGGMNSTLKKVKEHVQPIKAYLQVRGANFEGAPPGEKMDVYLHYGGNTSVGPFPQMANEGCLAFHFGIVKTGNIGNNNAVYLKFHGGGGNFLNNTITTHIDNAWKISFDDWLPSFLLDPGGINTRWLGYYEKFDIYHATINTPPPISGVVRAYTLSRVKWELMWMESKWNTDTYTTLDTSRIYLVGASQGCAGVLLMSITQPWKFAAGNMTVPKYNLMAPDDDNPNCKFNGDGAQVKQTRVMFGDENVTNLITDIPVLPSTSAYFRIYDLSNTNYTLDLRKDVSLPFLLAINGKTDIQTCWQEKIPIYNSIQTTHCGGIWEWDLRDHNSDTLTSWGSLDIRGMKRFNIHTSYPAFSNTSLDGNPGSDTISVPPYYNGDDVGSLHANIDWVDSSIVDSSYLWQIQLFSHQEDLQDSSLIPKILPEFSTTDLTIRRAQRFKGFTAGTKLCWMNFYHGQLIQSGVITQSFDDTSAAPLTVEGVNVFPDHNIFRIMLCDSVQPTGLLPMKLNKLNEAHSSLLNLNDGDSVTASVFQSMDIFNLAGTKISDKKFLATMNNNKAEEWNTLSSGVYLIRMNVNGIPVFFKWVKT